MNKSVKILLLVVAVIIAIGGVLLFMKTIVSPPQDLEFKNQFEVALNEKIDGFKKVDYDNLEREFVTLTDLVHRFKDESAIDTKCFDKVHSKIIGIYTPKFSQYCLNEFQKPAWDDSQHSWIIGRISYLNNLTIEDGSLKILDNYPDIRTKLTSIANTIDLYRKAKALSLKTRYSGMTDARCTISQANQYKNDVYLKNNVALINALNTLPSRIEGSHFATLVAKVHSLSNYHLYSKDDYESLSDNVAYVLNEYKQNAKSVYGQSRSISDLSSEAARYYDEAMEYYKNENNLEKI